MSFNVSLSLCVGLGVLVKLSVSVSLCVFCVCGVLGELSADLLHGSNTKFY